MIELRIHHKNSVEQATMRDELCRSLVGWKPFIDSEVAVCDTASDDPEPITHLVLGPNPTKSDETVAILDVRAEDLQVYVDDVENGDVPDGYPPVPRLYGEENAE